MDVLSAAKQASRLVMRVPGFVLPETADCFGPRACIIVTGHGPGWERRAQLSLCRPSLGFGDTRQLNNSREAAGLRRGKVLPIRRYHV